MTTWRSNGSLIPALLIAAALAGATALTGCAHTSDETQAMLTPSQAMSGPPARVVHHYFDYLEHGAFDEALALWRADALNVPTRTKLQQTYVGLAHLRSSIIGRTAYDETPDGVQATVNFRIIEYRMLAQQPQTYSGTCVLLAEPSPAGDATPRRWQIKRLEWTGTGPRILRSR